MYIKGVAHNLLHVPEVVSVSMYAHCRMKIVHTEGREARTEIRKALDRTCNCDVTKLFLVSTYKGG